MRVLAVGDHFFIISKMSKTSCFKSRHFINIYIINRTLHGRLGIRVLSSRAESISHSFASLTRERYFQHEKIKFVSPRGHVISSISFTHFRNDEMWSPTAKTRMLCNMKQDMKVMKNKSYLVMKNKS